MSNFGFASLYTSLSDSFHLKKTLLSVVFIMSYKHIISTRRTIFWKLFSAENYSSCATNCIVLFSSATPRRRSVLFLLPTSLWHSTFTSYRWVCLHHLPETVLYNINSQYFFHFTLIAYFYYFYRETRINFCSIIIDQHDTLCSKNNKTFHSHFITKFTNRNYYYTTSLD